MLGVYSGGNISILLLLSVALCLSHTHTHTPQDCTEEGVGYVLDACVVWKSRREL